MKNFDKQDILWRGKAEVNAQFEKHGVNESRQCEVVISVTQTSHRKVNVYFWSGRYWAAMRKIKETNGFIRDIGRVENGEWIGLPPHVEKLFERVVARDWSK